MVSIGNADTPAHGADGRPARIQRETCDNLGNVAFELTGTGAAITAEGTPVAPPEELGAADSPPIQLSETTVATSLSQLTRRNPYAIVVYESDEAMDRIIACGNVGGVLAGQMSGMVMPGDVLTVWLPEVADSRAAGVAQIEAKGMEAIVRLILAEEHQGAAAGGAMPGTAVPAATPVTG